MEKKTIIKITNLFKSFPVGKRENTVLKNIHLEIYKGELMTVFGPSGCGKSTLLNTVMGIERPDSGEIRILGINLWDMNADDRADMRKRNIGVVYQAQNWIKSLTVLENVALSAQLLGFDKEESIKKAKEKLSKVGLVESENQFTSELSAGEQQKVGLARALISNPQVIIADEPTGNLDTTSGYDVLNILKELTQQGVTVVLVTHNPEYLQFSDRVTVMKDGMIIEIIENKNGIREKVEKAIAKEYEEIEVVRKGTPKTETNQGELDYPKTSFTKNISQYSLFILRFFVESVTILSSSLLSKISEKRAQEFRTRMYKEFKNKKKISAEISNLELTEISFKNLLFKKFRTTVTVIGVGLGVAFVLLLLSLGYGFERIVVNEMTTAQNLKQLDVFPKVGSLLVLNDELVGKIKDISGVEKIYKLKNFAGRLNYGGSTADVVVYGIEDQYLENSPSKKIAGKFLSNESENNEILVNTEYLNLFGFSSDEILGKTLEMEIVQSSPAEEEKFQPVQVTVSGVIEDDYPPVAYLKMESVQKYVGDSYSQATIVVRNESSLDSIRKQVESLGLESFSVMDTINQVENLFTYIRYGLLFFGTVAFLISFLGMVNTLVVSLLERTREVGLMKIVGMKKNDIMTIFITESMLIGFTGGLLGIFFGYIAGYLVSIIVYLFSMSRGVGFVNISFIPPYMIIITIILTTLLGFVTGLYPAKRAIKIPPLDALRYE